MSKVIGGGAIAERFHHLNNQFETLVFAPNSENSQMVVSAQFEEESNELRRLISLHPSSKIVYFSSCSVLDPSLMTSNYVIYKKSIEALIQKLAPNYLIVRLPQVVSRESEESNLSRYIVDRVLSGEPFEVWSGAKRNFIDLDDVFEIVRGLLQSQKFRNKIINVANPNSVSVIDFVQTVESVFGLEAKYQIIDKSSEYEIDVSPISDIVGELNINFDDSYLRRTIVKYYEYRTKGPKLLSIIVPTYNEELGIDEFYNRTKAVVASLAPQFDYEIIFVNDGSVDRTQDKLRNLARADGRVRVIRFSRNFGNQAGITAGIDIARGDLAVVIDDDLQDPPEVILEMIAQWHRGYKVVYAVRNSRKSINPILRVGAWLYYQLLSKLSDTKIPRNTGDFRLLDHVVLNSLREMRESNRYLRGLVAWVGFPQIGIGYARDARYAGTTKFTFKKYLKFAIDGVSSFSEKPLSIISGFGFIVTCLSGLTAIALIILKVLEVNFITVSGWTSLMVGMLFLGGLQIFSIGVVGVYLSKVLGQVKDRPLYIVEESINI